MPTAYVTVPTEIADDIAAAVVEERLAACVNQIDCRSTYRWDGEFETADETILLIKTTAAGYDRLVDRLETLHPYEVPCIERFDETALLERFGDWIDDAVDP